MPEWATQIFAVIGLFVTGVLAGAVSVILFYEAVKREKRIELAILITAVAAVALSLFMAVKDNERLAEIERRLDVIEASGE